MVRCRRAASLVCCTTACVLLLCLLRVYQPPDTLHHLDLTRTQHLRRTKFINFNRILLTMHKRRQKLEDVCHKLAIKQTDKWIHEASLDHIIVDDLHKILYCYVPKVACTNWKRIMMILRNTPTTFHNSVSPLVDPLNIPANESHQQNYFQTLDKYNRTEIVHRLRRYFKFMFARHPFERLVSAYRNKFQQPYSVYFQQRFGRLIVQRHRANASNESLSRGHDVTFEEFVSYLLDPLTSQESPLNEHWRPIFQLCHPCHIHYDVIGKYETLSDDADFVLHRARVQRWVYFPKINKTVDTSSLTENMFANLTTEQQQRLHRMYELDFSMFGYDNKIT